YGNIGVSASIERGEMFETSRPGASAYAVASVGLRAGLGALGSVGVSASTSAGRTLTGANGDLLGAGANAQLYLPGRIEFGLSMTAQRATFGVLDSSGAWFSVTDARLERRFESNMTVGLHARILQNPTTFGSP